MDIVVILMVVSIGGLAGLFAGLLGIGGGIVMTPLLLLVFQQLDLPAEEAVIAALTSSLIAVMFTSIPSFITHASHHSVNWRIFLWLAPTSVVGALIGSNIALLVHPFLIVLVLILFLLQSCWKIFRTSNKAKTDKYPKVINKKIVGVGLSAGLIGAFTGTGGGLVVTPLLNRFGLPLIVSIGTSAGNTFFIGISASLVYGGKGVDLAIMAALIPSCFLMSIAGARLANVLSKERLKIVYVLLLILIIARLIWWLVVEFVI